jgi:uncharacterized protein with HEPN domain
MRPKERDLAYLWDMRHEARQVIAFIKNVPYAKFAKNNMIRYAVERSLMIIGEAANHISDEFQDAHPEIAWRQIVGQRNVLAHEYGDVSVDRVWSTATNNIPQLLQELEKMIPD